MLNKPRRQVRKIAVFPLGNINVPSSRLRILRYKKMFENLGIKFLIFYEEPITYAEKLVNIFHFITADLLFVQKRIFTGKKNLLSKIFNKKVVFDIDDAIYVDQKTGLVNEKELNKLLKFVSSCRLVVVGNSNLGATLLPYSQKQLTMITLPVNSSKPHPHKIFNNIRIGWIGTKHNLPYLEELKSVFVQLQRKYQFDLVVICSDKPTSFNDIKYTFIKWNLDVDMNISRYFDVGIMPLPDNRWTRGKCGYKILQYYSFGLPVIASPVGVNRELVIEHEIGFLAGTVDKWYEYLELFIRNPDIVPRMSVDVSEHFLNNYSSSKQFQLLLDNMNELL